VGEEEVNWDEESEGWVGSLHFTEVWDVSDHSVVSVFLLFGEAELGVYVQ